jgi:tetratricopeptide (TPR) repeat protein
MMTWFLMLFTIFLFPSPVWSLPDTWRHPVSSVRTLTGDELLRIGQLHDAQDHHQEALNYYQLALSAYRGAEQKGGQAAALVKMAGVQERRERVREAYSSLQEAMKLLGTKGSPRVRADAALATGRLAAQLGHDAEAETYLGEAVTLYDRLQDPNGRHAATVQLALLRVQQGRLEEGLAMLERERAEARARHAGGHEANVLLALGDVHWVMGQYEEAQRIYAESLHMTEAERNEMREAKLRLRLAQSAGELGRPEEGIEFGRQASSLYQVMRKNAGEAAAQATLADLYRRAGKDGEAEAARLNARRLYRSRQLQVHGSG